MAGRKTSTPEGALTPAPDTDTDDAALERLQAAAPGPDPDAELPEPTPIRGIADAPDAEEDLLPGEERPAGDGTQGRLDLAHAERNKERDQLMRAQAFREAFGDSLELGVTLQDLKISAATNGNNYWMTLEVSMSKVAHVAAAAGAGAHIATFDVDGKRIDIGDGITVRRGGFTRDADGEPHMKFGIQAPANAIREDPVGKLGVAVGRHGTLTLTPTQGKLGLPDGTAVDLTARAE